MRPDHWLFTIPLRLRPLFRRAQTDQELDHLTGGGAPLRLNATPEPRSRNNQMIVLEILWYQTIRRAVRTFSALLEERAIGGEYTPGRGEDQASVARMACTPLFAHGVLAG